MACADVGDDGDVWLHKVISQDLLVLFRQGHVFHYYSFSLFFQSQAEEGNHLPDIGPSPSFDFLDFAVAMDYLQAASATSSHMPLSWRAYVMILVTVVFPLVPLTSILKGILSTFFLWLLYSLRKWSIRQINNMTTIFISGKRLSYPSFVG